MDHPVKILENRFGKLELEGCPVVVMPYATSDDCSIITDALKKFDGDYNPDYTSKSQLKKMPGIVPNILALHHMY